MQGSVIAVSLSATHTMRKANTARIELIEGLGIRPARN
jgi:hypothetical protein